ncbi:tail fiber protein [Flagellimonas pacifica]|uniref:BZIP transcription factor n=1 Tax=Flagellimonas pacifica TaxID=1247520 RepID=A0A285MRR4_9FLAO|nr:tail fiber protein [Allomuricauda parva]SNY99879.1 hypothetical protein SAMN06265377_1693 [Allomuricauda parva]
MKKLILIGAIFLQISLTAQQKIELDPTGAAGGDIMGLKVTETGNNTTRLHVFKNFTNDSNDINLLTIDKYGNTELRGSSQLRWNPVGAAGGDFFGIKVTESGNNTTKFHFFRNFTNDTQDIDKLVIDASGNVGVGTSNPGATLHIMDQGNTGVYSLKLNNRMSFRGDGVFEWGASSDSGILSWDTNRAIIGGKTGQDLSILASGERIRIKANGNVGIGTTSPDSKLAVNGNIHAKEVKVDLAGWPDYVFEKEYHLPSLQEVEAHIEEKGHLRNIPSAKEVEENGIKLGEMNSKLLEKIEELMLYTIKQQKEIENLKKEIVELKSTTKK